MCSLGVWMSAIPLHRLTHGTPNEHITVADLEGMTRVTLALVEAAMAA